ncbi:unnamed protein product [Choristocarpus tenellus]
MKAFFLVETVLYAAFAATGVSAFSPAFARGRGVVAIGKTWVLPKVLRSSTSSTLEADVRGGPIFPTDQDQLDDWFDSRTIGMPRVHRYVHDDGDKWVMWYHGQDKEFDKDRDGVMNIGTGRIGRAESSDGIHWIRTPGQMTLNSVVDVNTDQWWGFDTAHVGLGDVNLGASRKVQTDASVYFMYYFGGNFEETDVEKEFGLTKSPRSGSDASTSKGVRMRIGMALSQDGVNWSRVEGEHPSGCCLDVGDKGEWDELFVGWPIVINHEQREFRMYYHALVTGTKKYTVGMATSQDGMAWKKVGPVFEGGPPGSFDAGGASRRRIIKIKGVYHMLYEAVDGEGVHSIGLATSDDGKKWTRNGDAPVFERRSEDCGAWDSGGVSAPEIVDMDNGCWHLYYVGHACKDSNKEEGGSKRSALGVAVTHNDDFTKWERLSIA